MHKNRIFRLSTHLITIVFMAALLIIPTTYAQSDKVSGVIWEDTNCDGIRQDEESLIPNIRLTLRWAGQNGLIDGTDRDIEQAESLTGNYAFTLAGPGEPYFIAFRSEDKPANYILAPFQQGSDPIRDNDMTMPLAGTTLWATPVFTIPLDGSPVTGYDVGLCKIVLDHMVYLPVVIR